MTSGGIFWTHTVHVRPHVRVRVFVRSFTP